MQYVAKSDMSPHPRSGSIRHGPLHPPPGGHDRETFREGLADPDFELIVNDPLTSFRWHRHDYPSPLARWNYHPEFEIHMIAESTGKMFVGDHIGPFGPGNLVLIGPNLPHHWVSDIGPGQSIAGRDVVLQFSGRFFEEARSVFPEFERISRLLEDSRRGVEFCGDDARACGDLLVGIGACEGLERIARFVTLLQRMLAAEEKRGLACAAYHPALAIGEDARIGPVIEYVFRNIHDARMSAAAAVAGMSESTFSRHFKKMTGNNFVDCVRKIRVARACTLLESDGLGITEICFECGFQNISNFNRSFRREKAMTPREYRSCIRMRRAGRVDRVGP